MPWRGVMGIPGIGPGPRLSRRGSEHPVNPYLPRDITGAYPNRVWGVDVTFIRLHTGWLYLVAVLDRFSLRRQLGTGPPLGAAVRSGRRRAGTAPGHAGDLEQRPGQPLHPPPIPATPDFGRRADRHGWEGAAAGHHRRR